MNPDITPPTTPNPQPAEPQTPVDPSSTPQSPISPGAFSAGTMAGTPVSPSSGLSSKKKALIVEIILLVLVVVGVSAYFLMRGSTLDDTQSPANSGTVTPASADSNSTKTIQGVNVDASQQTGYTVQKLDQPAIAKAVAAQQQQGIADIYTLVGGETYSKQSTNIAIAWGKAGMKYDFQTYIDKQVTYQSTQQKLTLKAEAADDVMVKASGDTTYKLSCSLIKAASSTNKAGVYNCGGKLGETDQFILFSVGAPDAAQAQTTLNAFLAVTTIVLQ